MKPVREEDKHIFQPEYPEDYLAEFRERDMEGPHHNARPLAREQIIILWASIGSAVIGILLFADWLSR